MRAGGLPDGWDAALRASHLTRAHLTRAHLTGARLLSLGASAALNLLGIAALIGFLDYHVVAHRDPGARLTVVALAPAEPPAPPPRHASPAHATRRAPAVAARDGTSAAPAISPQAEAPASKAAPALPREDSAIPQAAPPRSQSAAQAVPVRQKTAGNDYQMQLWRQINARRPRGIQASGSAIIAFRLAPDGALLAASLSRTSGNVLLDRIALRTVRQAAPFPPPPEGTLPEDLAFEIPVNFR